MADESEKRFQSIMDKLFYAPKPASPSSSASRGKKRPNPGSALAFVEPKLRRDVVEGSQSSSAQAYSSQAPACRPWDRGDLMRRLATFKSMTWFGKPKVVNAVNCARRGWVNIDVDIIACEACGARLLFSTPSSWTQQQIEKAALVFSLKLDNGHKLLCPWIDNACDEKLAQFPPTAPSVLVDKFRQRSSALLQLLALPVVSFSAIEHMQSSQLEQFLKDSSILEYGNGSANISPPEILDNSCEANLADLYYQAHRFISLCGWEPRSVPYVVDCKDGPNQHAISNPTHSIANGSNTSITLLSVGTGETLKVDGNSKVSNDPKSVVLDCRLCGASVGLWAFSTVPQPVELFRLVGYTEINDENKSACCDSVNEREGSSDAVSNGLRSSKDKISTLKLTIAGGPPPKNQNFKATISLPIVGQNLRARFSYDSDFRDRVCVNKEGTGYEAKNRFLSQNKNNITGNPVSEQVLESGGVGNRHGHEQCSSMSDAQSYGLNHGNREKSDNIEDMNIISFPSEGGSAIEGGTFLEAGTNVEEGTGVKARVQLPIGNEAVTGSTGKRQKQVSSDKAMEFDPIRQHRHFCPWIASTGSGAPGWKQTLIALQRHNESSHPSPKNSPSTASIFEVDDDPIASVRRLFMSPSPKRIKPTHGSS